MPSYFGHKGAVSDPLDFFAEENYIVCRGATHPGAVDTAYNLFNEFIAKSNDYYLRQSSHWERNRFTDAGGVENCLLQPHQFKEGRNGEFSDSLLRLLSEQHLMNALVDISNAGPYALVQTMFFDHSTTEPHQDWIYLDSRPNGKMIAAWIALEDIPEECIRFYVYLRSHTFMPKSVYGSYNSDWDLEKYHANFTCEIDQLIQSGNYEMYAPPLKKGDIFFWSSRIVHGSIPGENRRLRRRSIAAHFIPVGYSYGNLERDFDISYEDKYGLKHSTSQMDEYFKQKNSEG